MNIVGKYQSDGISIKGLCLIPMFMCEVILLTLIGLTSVFATVTRSWPRFCFSHSSIFFLNIEIFVSLAIMEISAVVVWIVFEHNNWVHYVVVYLTHGTFMFFVGGFYVYSVTQGCPGDEGLYPPVRAASEDFFDLKEVIIQTSIMVIGLGYFSLGIFCCTYKEKFSYPRKTTQLRREKLDLFTREDETNQGDKDPYDKIDYTDRID